MFKKAVQQILKWEAGYVNDPADPGGETKYGISKRSYPALNIRDLTQDAAEKIYFADYWTKCKCDKMPYSIALLVFDTAVNMGTGAAVKMLQQALNINPDGIPGSETISTVAKMDEQSLAIRFCALRMQRYTALEGWGRYGIGWSRRVFDTTISAFKR
jgi:lysozyme family protein